MTENPLGLHVVLIVLNDLLSDCHDRAMVQPHLVLTVDLGKKLNHKYTMTKYAAWADS